MSGTTKAVLNIDVADQKFRDFLELFRSYKVQLELMPAEWLAVAEATRESAKATRELTEGLAGMPADIERAARAQARFHATATDSSRMMDRLSSGAKSFAGYIESAAKNIMGWTFGLAGLGAVGLGGASLFMLDRLGGAAAGMRRESLGLGVSTGAMNAFRVDLGRFVDPGFLGRVSEQQRDRSQWANLSILAGTPINQIGNMDPADLATKILQNFQRQAQRDPNGPPSEQSLLGNLARQVGLTNEEIRRLYGDRSGELGKQTGAFQTDRTALNVPDESARKFQDFMTQLERAEKKIETVLINALDSLAGPLGDVSTALSRLITSLVEAPAIRRWIDELAPAIEKFATVVGSKQFADDVEAFGAEVGRLADDLFKLARAVAHAIEWFTGSNPAGGPRVDRPPPVNTPGRPGTSTPEYRRFKERTDQLERGDWSGYFRDWWNEITGGTGTPSGNSGPHEVMPGAAPPPGFHIGPSGGFFPDQPATRPQSTPYDMEGAKFIPATWLGRAPWQGGTGGMGASPALWMGGGRPGAGGGQYGGLEAAQGLPGGLLHSVEMAESGGNVRAISSAGAEGPFQFIHSTAERYGLTDPFDEQQSAVAASRYLGDLTRMFGGDIAKAVASYNWGEGAVQRDVMEHGADWLNFAPAETQKYVQRVLGGIGRGGFGGMGGGQQQVVIRIENNTGGSAVVSTSQLAV